jgi:hypothetical protein
MSESKRVSSKSKDDWEFTGNRLLTLEVVNLRTGESAKVRAVIDMDKKQFSVECRKCSKWGVYSIDKITEEEKMSGLCPACFKQENSETYVFGINEAGELVNINTETGEEESAIYTDEQIKNYEKLLYPNVKFTIVPCTSDPFSTATELLFVDGESEYGKAIHNASIRKGIARMKAYEQWKKTYPRQLLELLSWDDEDVSEKKFSEVFPEVPSASGKKITTTFLKSMREYCGYPLSSFVPQWQGFEFSVRDTVERWGQLDSRRYLIFKQSSTTFAYNEIDTLGKGSNVNVLLDAKSCGGNVDKSQMQTYLKFFKAINLPISKGVFVTADDDFGALGDNVYRLPFEWFQCLKSIDEVDLLVDRIIDRKFSKS